MRRTIRSIRTKVKSATPQRQSRRTRRAPRRSSRAAVAGRLRRIAKTRPSRRHVRAALMATVPPAALFGFAGVQGAAPAAAKILSAPLAEPVAPVAALNGLAEPLLAHPDDPAPAAVEASYYGNGFEGRPTASGERFDPERLTAAHRTLAFGTMVRVTDAVTGKSVDVRINDRGPFHGNREIDLSTAAAREIGMLASGTAKVTLQVVGRG